MEWERVRELGVWMKWAELLKYGMLLSSNSAFCTFFFFFEFRPESAVLESADFARYDPNWPEFKLRRRESTEKKKKKSGRTRPNVRAMASLVRHAASDAGATHLMSRPCFPIFFQPSLFITLCLYSLVFTIKSFLRKKHVFFQNNKVNNVTFYFQAFS